MNKPELVILVDQLFYAQSELLRLTKLLLDLSSKGELTQQAAQDYTFLISDYSSEITRLQACYQSEVAKAGVAHA